MITVQKVVGCLLVFTAFFANAQQVKVSSGKVQRYAEFPSQFIDSRYIDVWLPEGYSDKEKYSVVYMQDGQVLFDGSTGWNKQEWRVDETAAKLIAQGSTQKFIVVGIMSISFLRHSEMLPQKVFESIDKKKQDSIYGLQGPRESPLFIRKVSSDNYLKFIVSELKPFIDKTYSVQRDAQHTFIAGANLGALLSLYAVCEYPDVFGGAACLSTQWTGIEGVLNNPFPMAMGQYLKAKLPAARSNRFYFDRGDQGLDASFASFQQQVDAMMRSKGYTDTNWVTKIYPGANHSEKSWAERLDVPFTYLLAK